MKGLALLGCIVLLLILCVLFVFIFAVILDMDYGRELGCWILILTFIIVASCFIVYPEKFGYEKVSTVSENAVESEEK